MAARMNEGRRRHGARPAFFECEGCGAYAFVPSAFCSNWSSSANCGSPT